MAAAAQRKGNRGRAVRRKPDSTALALGENLTIVEAGRCQQALNDLLERGHTNADAHALRQIDTAGLQLLLAAGRTARARGLTLRVLGARALLLEAASNLGLTNALTEVVELMP